MDIHIPFSILSKNQINDRYMDPSSVQFLRCEGGLRIGLSVSRPDVV